MDIKAFNRLLETTTNVLENVQKKSNQKEVSGNMQNWIDETSINELLPDLEYCNKYLEISASHEGISKDSVNRFLKAAQIFIIPDKATQEKVNGLQATLFSTFITQLKGLNNNLSRVRVGDKVEKTNHSKHT